MPSDQHAGAGNRGSTSSDAPGHNRSMARTWVIPPGTVPRPRLVARLSLAIHRPLTLVSAPAGFGKTMLLDAWAARYPGPAEPHGQLLRISTTFQSRLVSKLMTAAMSGKRVVSCR